MLYFLADLANNEEFAVHLVSDKLRQNFLTTLGFKETYRNTDETTYNSGISRFTLKNQIHSTSVQSFLFPAFIFNLMKVVISLAS